MNTGIVRNCVNATALSLLLTLQGSIYGQTATPSVATPLKLEVTSVKVAPPGKGMSIRSTSGNRFSGTLSLRFLLMNAFRVQDFQVSGAPEWMNSPFFEIEAKTESPFSSSELPLLIQAVLCERFVLHTHN